MKGKGWWLSMLYLGLALACNAPLSEPTAPPPAPTDPTDDNGVATTTPSATPEPTDAGPTASPELATTEITAEATTPRPTFTPVLQPTLASTPTSPPTNTPRPTRTSAPAATATPSSSGPLSLQYHVSWALDPNDPFKAIATVTLSASGGSGLYTFYHDELPVAGPMFTYEWGACRGNPGSFRVDSSDGQSVKIDYFENPPCPTPTPTS